MKDNCTTLYPTQEVGYKISDYADDHSLHLTEKLDKYQAWVHQSQEKSAYSISMLEARYLTWTARMIGAKRGEGRLEQSSHCFHAFSR